MGFGLWVGAFSRTNAGVALLESYKMIYTYLCRDCGNYFEASLTILEYNTHDMVCSKCHSANVKRTYQPNTVVYNTDGFTKRTVEEVVEDD